MSRDAAAVAHDLGKLLSVPAALAGVSLPVAWLSGATNAIVPLAVTAAGVGGAGFTLAWRYRRARAEHRWPAVEVVALGWLSAGLVGAAVLMALGATAPDGSADTAFRDPVNAVFEAISGVTSTGLTVVAGEEAELTPIAQWWRSLLQWAGGVGMVVFALGFGRSASRMRVLYEAEGRHADLPGGVRGTVRRTVAVYLGLTVAVVGILALTEHDAWTALNHGLSGISTGGFNVTGDSLAGYNAPTRLVGMGVIFLGSSSFVAHYLLFVRGDPVRWWRLTPVRAHALTMAAGVVLLMGVNAVSRGGVAVVDSAFQWFSAAATAGFQTDPDLSRWTTPALLTMAAAMFVGASSGSTGGGLKLDRAVWLAKEVVRALRKGERQPVRWDGQTVPQERRARIVGDAATLAGLWVTTATAGIVAIAALTDAPLVEVVFDVVSAQSNVGLDVGLVGPDLTASAKLVLAALMYAGRLELFVALVLSTQREPA